MASLILYVVGSIIGALAVSLVAFTVWLIGHFKRFDDRNH